MEDTILYNGNTYTLTDTFCNDNFGAGREYSLYDQDGDIVDTLYFYDEEEAA